MGKTLDDTTIKMLAACAVGSMLTKFLLERVIAGELKGYNEVPLYSTALMNTLQELEQERRKELVGLQALAHEELNNEQNEEVKAYVCSLLEKTSDGATMLRKITPPELFEEFKERVDDGTALSDEFIKRLREKLTN